jgi:gamma-glutamylcyclotransferase (GGCT)/AIG2-like uncharacterized protein YtfP
MNRKEDHSTIAVRESWAAVGAIAAVAGVVVAIVQVYIARPSIVLISALAGLLLLTAGLLIASVKLQVRRLGQRVYVIKNKRHEQRYYDAFAAALRSSRDQIYYAGRGFDGLTPESKDNADRIVEATREGLRNGAKLCRIQTSSHVSEAWAEAYAALAEQYKSDVSVFQDLGDPTLVNIGIYDPNSDHCIVQVVFEVQQHHWPEPIHRVVGGCFIYGNKELARGLQALFLQRLETLAKLSADEIRALPHQQQVTPMANKNVAIPSSDPRAEDMKIGTLFNFAYGSNIDPDWMRRRAPSARVVGTGWLRGWERRLDVLAPDHYPDGGAIAGLYRSDEGSVEGVVYEISRQDKARLDEYELETGYGTETVTVELGERGQVSLSCFIYVMPSTDDTTPGADPAPPPPPPPSPIYLSQLMMGAQRMGLSSVKQLVVEYRSSLGPDTEDGFEIPTGFA